MRIVTSSFGLAVVAALALTAAPKPSLAGSFDFTVCAVGGGCNGGSSPFGTVTTTYDTVADETTVSADLTGSYAYFGAGNNPVVFAFNQTGAALAVDTSTLPAAGGTWTYFHGSTPNGNPPAGSIGGMTDWLVSSTHNV